MLLAIGVPIAACATLIPAAAALPGHTLIFACFSGFTIISRLYPSPVARAVNLRAGFCQRASLARGAAAGGRGAKASHRFIAPAGRDAALARLIQHVPVAAETGRAFIIARR